MRFLGLALLLSAMIGLEAVGMPVETRRVDFKEEVAPLLRDRCASCHGRGKAKGGFRMDTLEDFLSGGNGGPVVEPGDSEKSYLIELVNGDDPDLIMPEKGRRLSSEEVEALRAWIDQGLPWDETVSFAKPPARNLTPRRPEVPNASGVDHPVDAFVAEYFQAQGVDWPTPVTDERFLRRVSLDLVGLLPTPEAMNDFLDATQSDKRDGLVDALLADDYNYASHWMAFWNDLLRNDYAGTGFIDGGREQISEWLWNALATNMPYDQFVRELVDPIPESEGFTKGIVWRGVVNASQRPPVQAAQSISQVFLGVNLKCASCHDSFIDDWRLVDAYGLASVYAEEALEIVECDKPTGEIAEAAFLFPSIGGIEPGLDRDARTERLAALMLSPENGRVPRTIVNRVWARFFGRGLVEPLDVMQGAAWSPDLLDWLAEDFVESGYNLRHLMRRIVTSRIYQSESIVDGTIEERVFRGPIPKRIPAEAFADGVAALTESERGFPKNRNLNLNAARPESESDPEGLTRALGAEWIWAEDPNVATIYLTKRIETTEPVDSAFAMMTADNEFEFWVDGERLASSKDWKRPRIVDLTESLREPGRHQLAIRAKNLIEEKEASANPAGVLIYLTLNFADGTTERYGSGGDWRMATEAPEDWPSVSGKDADGLFNAGVKVLGPAPMEPWKIEDTWGATFSLLRYHGRIRASLAVNDPLMLALGRTNREQVVTRREETPTTLQALELTNGEFFVGWLREGAERVYERHRDVALESFAREYFRFALGRSPTPKELSIGMDVADGELDVEFVEDWIWALINHPEFQFIY